MFKRLLLAVGLLMAPLGIAGTYSVATATSAHAAGFCGLASEENGLDLRSGHRDLTHDYIFAFATETGHPVTVDAQPSGQYVNYGVWDICWTWQGTNSVGNYGVAYFLNVGTNAYAGEGGGALIVADQALGGGDVEQNFQCHSGGWFTLNPTHDASRAWNYWSSLDGFSNVEGVSSTNADAITPQDLGGYTTFCQ